MSYIKEAAGRNFKGQKFQQRLGPVTVITGDNFAGKSTVPDAIRLALSGYLPTIGKTAGALWDALAGNPEREGEVEVGVRFDNDRTSTVKLTRSKKGAVSQEGVPGTDIALDPMLLDVRTFFRLTAAERTATILRAAGDVSIAQDAVVEALWGIDASPAAMRDMAVRSLVADVEAEWGQGVTAASEKLLARWRDSLKEAKALAKVASGAFAGMKLPVKMPVEPVGLNEALAKRDSLLKLKGELDAMERAGGAKGAAWSEMEDAEGAVLNLMDELAQSETPGDKPVEPPVVAETKRLQHGVDEMTAKVRPMEDGIALLRAEIDRMRDHLPCPTCGAHGTVAAAKAKLIERFEDGRAMLERLNDEIDKAEMEVEERMEEVERYEQKLAEWTHRGAEIERLTKAIAAAQARHAKAKARHDNIAAADAGKRDEILKALEALPELEASISAMRAQQEEVAAYNRLVKEREKREQEVLRGDCTVKVLDGAIKKLNELIAGASEAAFGKVLGLAKAFTDGLLNSPLEFRDGELGRCVSKEDRKAGRTADVGSWISYLSFSGTEELIAMAGFAVALARLAPFKLVVLDEMGRLTRERRALVANRMVDLVKAGTIDQAILIDAGEGHTAYGQDGITLVKL